MADVSSTSLSNRSADLATFLRDSSETSGQSRSAPNNAPGQTDSANKSKTGNSAVLVDLSDRAKATIERAKAEKLVVDRLSAQLLAMKGDDADRADTKSFDWDALISLVNAQGIDGGTDLQARPEGALLPDGSRLTNWRPASEPGGSDVGLSEIGKDHNLGTGALLTRQPGDPISSEDLEAMYTRIFASTLASQPDDARAQAFREAYDNRTLNIQHAEDVEGLNFRLDAVVRDGFQTDSMRYSQTSEMKENDRQVIGWAQGFGGFYVTWPEGNSDTAAK